MVLSCHDVTIDGSLIIIGYRFVILWLFNRKLERLLVVFGGDGYVVQWHFCARKCDRATRDTILVSLDAKKWATFAAILVRIETPCTHGFSDEVGNQ